MIDLILIMVAIHWGYATGSFIAWKTNWSIERFLIIILLLWTLIKLLTPTA